MEVRRYTSTDTHASTIIYSLCSSFISAGGEAEQYDTLLKLVLVGDSNVGKTALLSRFMDDNFGDNLISTIGGILFNLKFLSPFPDNYVCTR